eukprot:2969203-Rhodomonas_salina.2
MLGLSCSAMRLAFGEDNEISQLAMVHSTILLRAQYAISGIDLRNIANRCKRFSSTFPYRAPTFLVSKAISPRLRDTILGANMAHTFTRRLLRPL